MAVSSLFITHRFLNYRFLGYGFQVWEYFSLPEEEREMEINGKTISNPMCNTFPRIASCEYHSFGSGGQDQTVSAICILALNIINDKVSVFSSLVFEGTKAVHTMAKKLNCKLS